MRQRNVPVDDVAQTDIKLVHDPVYYDLAGSRYNSLLESRLLSSVGLVRTEGDLDLLSMLRQELNVFRGAKVEGCTSEDLAKRLQWIEAQIQGLAKRSLSVKTTEGLADYYTLVGDLQTKLERQLALNNSFEPKITQANSRIVELEAEVASLRISLLRLDDFKLQNDAYRGVFRQLTDIVKDPRRVRDIEKLVNDQVAPLLNEFELKLQNLTRASSTTGRTGTDPKSRLRAQVTGMLRGFQRIMKGTDELNLANVQNAVGSLLKEIELTSNFELYQNGQLLKHKYEDLLTTASANASMFKQKLEVLARDFPQLREEIDLELFAKVTASGVKISNFNSVIFIDETGLAGKTRYYQTQDKNTLNMLALISRKMRLLLGRYPKLKEELGNQLYEFVTTHVFDDAISMEEMERLVEVVKYQPSVVKVENVYQVNSEKNVKAIFHLKIMIKALLEELLRLRDQNGLVLDIDEGLIGMIRGELEGMVDVDDVLRVFRSIPKIVEIQKIVEKELSKYLGYLTKTEPLTLEHAKYVQKLVEKPIILHDQVALTVEKGVVEVEVHEKAVEFITEKVLEVMVRKEVPVEKAVYEERIVEVPVKHEVPFYETKFQEVDKVIVEERKVEVLKEMEVQVAVPIERVIKEIIEVPRFEEKLVQVVREVTNIKEVKVVEQVPIETIKYVEVEKITNNFIKVPQIVEVKEQVPVYITNTIEKPVDVIETIEKIVMVVHTEEKLVEVPVEVQVPFINEIAKEITNEVMVKVKGDLQEKLVTVDRIVEKPMIKEMLVTKDVQIEKAVPVYITTQKPVIVEVRVPYAQPEPQMITCDIQQFIPFREEVPVEVVREVPVPIIQEKEVIKQVRVQVDKIIEKIVEVPRVVEVQKIVEKIVVVPRIIQNIIHVPQIIEKIVEREVEVIKIVQIERFVPIYMTHEVKEIITQNVPQFVDRQVVKTVEIEKVVALTTEKEILKEVEVERRIPVELIRDRDVPTIQEKIVELIRTVYDIEYRDRQVSIPLRQEIPKELIQQKAVEIKKIIENVIQVPQVITKEVVLYETKNEPFEVKLIEEKIVEHTEIKEYTNTVNLIETKVEFRDLIKQKVVHTVESIEKIKPEPYVVEKIVVRNDVHQSGVEILLEKPVAMNIENIREVQVPINYFVDREVPRNLYTEKVVEVRTIVDNIKTVELEGAEKVVAITNIKPEVVQVKEEVIKYLNQEVEKRLTTQVPVRETQIDIIEGPERQVLVKELEETRINTVEPVYVEKVVERVILLPQILEVLKNVHHLSEDVTLAGLGVALGVSVEVHTQDYVKLCESMRGALEGLLVSLRASKSPESIALLELVQKLLPMIVNLIKFPTIVQVPHEVEKIVEREKIVKVPTRDQEAINLSLASSVLIEKLIGELKRLRGVPGIKLQLDKDVQDIFFVELKPIENMDDKLKQFMNIVVQKFHALGSWSDDHSFMLNGFLQERFLMAGIIKEANEKLDSLRRQLDKSDSDQIQMSEAITRLNIHNIGLRKSLEELVLSLQELNVKDVDPKVKVTLEGLALRGRTVLDSDLSLELDRIFDSHSRSSSFVSSLETERLRVQLRNYESEIASFQGGQSERNLYLKKQIAALEGEIDVLRSEVNTSRSLRLDAKPDQSKVHQLQSEVETLTKQLILIKQDYERKLLRQKEISDKEINESRRFASIMTTASGASEQVEHLRNLNIELESKLRGQQSEITLLSNKKSQVEFELSRREVELQDISKKLQDSRIVADFRITTRPEDMAGSRTVVRHGQADYEEATGIKKIAENLSSSAFVSRFDSSPDVRQTIRFNTPADQQRSQQGTFQAMFVQPASQQQVRTIREPSELSSSQASNQQAVRSPESTLERRLWTLRELCEMNINERVIAQLMIKVMEKVKEETSKGRYMHYSPENIHVAGYSPNSSNLESVKVKLGEPINRQDEENQVYLAPEILRGENATEKSSNFNLAIIWDELLNGSRYFRTVAEIESPQYEYKARNSRILPIYKNTLFEMLKKDSQRRISLAEVLRRLELQHTIAPAELQSQSSRSTRQLSGWGMVRIMPANAWIIIDYKGEAQRMNRKHKYSTNTAHSSNEFLSESDDQNRSECDSERRNCRRSDQFKVRVLQRDLVYCVGLASEVATNEVLQQYRYLGQYGRIQKISTNKNSFSNKNQKGPSYSTYITFSNEVEAALAILALNNLVCNDRLVRASYGTTKYCTYFLKKQECPNRPDCYFLHSYERENEIDEAMHKPNKDMFDSHQKIAEQTIRQNRSKVLAMAKAQQSTSCVFPKIKDILNEFLTELPQVAKVTLNPQYSTPQKKPKEPSQEERPVRSASELKPELSAQEQQIIKPSQPANDLLSLELYISRLILHRYLKDSRPRNNVAAEVKSKLWFAGGNVDHSERQSCSRQVKKYLTQHLNQV